MEENTLGKLENSRRAWKTAITKHISGLTRHIAEEDSKAVEKRLPKLKEAFLKFEEAHDELSGHIESDDDMEKNDLYFVEVEGKYAAAIKESKAFLKSTSQNKTEAKPSLSAESKTGENVPFASKELAYLTNLSRLESEKFDGDPSRYHVFTSVFEESVKYIEDPKVKLVRLIQCTTGKANDSIKSCILMDGKMGYEIARKTLLERFGDDHLVCENMLQNIRRGKQVKTAEELRNLADELKHCFLTLKGMNRVHEIESQRCIVEVSERLQNHLRNRWKREAVDSVTTYKRYPCFEEFVEFVSKEARIANDPVYGNLHPKDSKDTTITPNSVKPKSFSTSFSSRASSDKKSFTKCILCSEEHRLLHCEAFRAKRPSERLDLVRRYKLCEICLLSNHCTSNCRRQYVCGVPNCGKRHSKYIHVDNSNMRNNSVPETSEVRMVNASVRIDGEVHMPTVAISVNQKQDVCAILDSASTNSFCTRNLADKLRLKGTDVSFALNTLNQTKENVTSNMVDLYLTSLDGSDALEVHNVFVIDEIPIKTSCPDVSCFSHLSGLQFVAGGQNIDLLIGQDNSEALIPLEVRRGKTGEPFACRTMFGWALNGPSNKCNKLNRNVVAHFISANGDSVEDKLNRLWDIECEDRVGHVLSQEDVKVEKLWNDHARLVNGHYELPIPFRENAFFPSNIKLASSRLTALKHKLNKDGLFERYQDELFKLFREGYAEFVPECEIEKSEGVWYLPHHAVINDKKPEKLRIVFDCASRYLGESLNEKCLQGPDYINKLLGVLIRFRQDEYAVMGDIESMYYQVKVPTEQRDYLRFLWYDNVGSLIHCRMTCHVFGGVWCASSTTYALRRTVEEFEPSPIVADTVLRSFYVDDCLRSEQSKSQVLEVVRGTADLLAKAGFKLTKFVANDYDVLESIPSESRAVKVKELISECQSKVLGVRWDVASDELYFETRMKWEGKITRRSMLSFIAAMYDPLGILGPVLVVGKMLLQEATRRKLSWDDKVPEDLCDQWESWLIALATLSQVRIPRCIKLHDSFDAVFELHHFCDASERAYGCCSYLRTVMKDGDIRVSLLFAKARVTPLKTMSIPRLELQAAVLAVNADRMLKSELDFDLLKSSFWTDSEIVLSYICNETKRFQTFVGNRIGTIRQFSQPSQWHHVRGSDNPADIISRGSYVESDQLWLRGPDFLKFHRSDWKMSSCNISLAEDDPEIKQASKISPITACVSRVSNDPLQYFVEYFSDWNRLKRAVGWMLRFKDFLRKEKSVAPGDLTFDEVKRAELAVLTFVQGQYYGAELQNLSKTKFVGRLSSLKDLSPFLSEDGLIKVGGRLENSGLSENQKHPCVIPYQHHVASLLARHFHEIAHLGCEWVVSQMRQKYWITRARSVVKKVRYSCMKCRKLFNAPCVQQMANLPAERLDPSKPPFTFTGVDCFGPLLIKRGRTEIKRYGCIYTCLTTRAIHLEKLDCMNTDSFLNGFRRFVSRRGFPEKVFSDNGSNFVGGKAELEKSLQQLNESKIYRYALAKGVEWNFIPPNAPHMGGVWERMVQTVKKVLLSFSDISYRLDDELLMTFLCEVENILNGRPITKASEDVKDPAPLSPNHLLLLKECPAISPGVFQAADLYKKRWRVVQYMADQFWQRWLHEYLPELQRRNKWLRASRNLKVGDLILLCDENTPRGIWPMGLVQEVFKGGDGLVRSVKVRTKSTTLVRPIVKCVLLEASD